MTNQTHQKETTHRVQFPSTARTFRHHRRMNLKVDRLTMSGQNQKLEVEEQDLLIVQWKMSHWES